MRFSRSGVVLFAGLVLSLAFAVAECHAGVWQNTSIGVGPQYSWFSPNNAPEREEFEVGGGIATTLRGPVTLVGSLSAGTDHGYARGDLGLDFTTYDASGWSVGAQAKRQWYSETDFGHTEWIAAGAVGKSFELFGHTSVGALLGAYGTRSESFRTTVSLSVVLKEAK